jgi:predicted short-subunit dehydrogenase-like oxidoreductase (DUF2520 family)
VPVRIAIVGPGRVGTTLARGFAAAGAEVLGFVGRNGPRCERAVAATGCGRVLTYAELARAHVVVFAVGDDDLAAAVQMAANAAGPRRCSLWLHTSGRHDLEVFVGIDGIRRGSLHPVAPFGDEPAANVLPGTIAVVAGEPRALSLLRRLCGLLGMQPLIAAAGDRGLYHAACALAANGATALWSFAEAALLQSGVVDPAAARQLVASLFGQATAACTTRGPAAALSGPVRRGDAATVALHLERLRALPGAAAAYAALAAAALDLARQAGLPPALGDRVAAVLPKSRP